MPINIPDGLPAKRILQQERIFALEEDVARKQQIRPLHVALLNLMPTKIETETQILRLISKSPIQVSVDFMRVSSHEATHAADHLVKFYDTFDDLKHNNYDGLITTGAPVEQMPFEEVDYWTSCARSWTGRRITCCPRCFCAGAPLPACITCMASTSACWAPSSFGVFPQRLCDEYNFLTNGFDEVHNMAAQPSRRARREGDRRRPRAAGALPRRDERPGAHRHARLP